MIGLRLARRAESNRKDNRSGSAAKNRPMRAVQSVHHCRNFLSQLFGAKTQIIGAQSQLAALAGSLRRT
jgi:hypothetical protein